MCYNAYYKGDESVKKIYLATNLKHLRLVNNKTQQDIAKVVGKEKEAEEYIESEHKRIAPKLAELREFFKDKNGIVRGYGIVDHKTKTAFDGSQVLRMAEWMEPQRKENEEKAQKGQKSIGSLGQKGQKGQKSIRPSGQSTPKLTNVDTICIAKHKNGKYYLRIILNNNGRSVIFFLSKEETRSYLLAADAMERERLKQQFAFKYLLHASGGSYDQNREWEVGHGQNDMDDESKLKR